MDAVNHQEMKYGLRIFVVCLGILALSLLNGQRVLGKVPDSLSVCVTAEEVNLYNLINDYRKVLRLPHIPLSNSLCRVAKAHITDLVVNRPDTLQCNFHSWSAKGNWKPCCYTGKPSDKICMTDKPFELTGYQGKAYEIVFWDNQGATASKAFDQWKITGVSKEMITNMKGWEKTTWNAMGIAIEKNFALLWLGDKPDMVSETKVCGSREVIANRQKVSQPEELISEKSGRFFLITASLSDKAEAKREMQKLIKKGFTNARLIHSENKFRVSVEDYASVDEAQEAKTRLEKEFKGIWVMAF